MLVAMTRRSRRSRLKSLHALVEPRQHDDRLDAVVAKRSLQLVLGVDRIERRDDCAELPGAELGHEELGAVGQQKTDSIASLDAEGRERRSERVALLLELRRSSWRRP